MTSLAHEDERPRLRIGLAAIVVIVGIVLAWSVWATVDVMVTARGRFVPGARARPVVSAEGGTVRNIHVRDGHAVRSGEVLVELDATSAAADRERIATQLAIAEVALRGRDATAIAAALSDRARIQGAALAVAQRALDVEAARADVARWGAARLSRAARERTQADTAMQIDRVRAELAGDAPRTWPRSAGEFSSAQRVLLESTLDERAQTLMAAEAAVDERRAAASALVAELGRSRAAADLARAALESRRRLFREGAIAALDLDEALQRYVDADAALAALRQRLAQEDAAVTAAQRRVASLRAESRKRSAGELSALAQRAQEQADAARERDVNEAVGLSAAQARHAQAIAALGEARAHLAAAKAEQDRTRAEHATSLMSQIAALRAELAKTSVRIAAHRLTAPIDGIVQQMTVFGAGATVMPGQSVLVVVPRTGPVEVEAWIPTKDAAFVKIGQEVDVKVDALPFTRHGMLRGTLAVVSADAIVVEGMGSVYAAVVHLSEAAIRSDLIARISPGMAATVDANVSSRRVLDFALSPLLETLRTAGRER